MSADVHVLRASDHELAKRAAAGDRDAQRAVFHAHRQRVHVILYRILGSNHEMDDLIQDAFIEVFRSLPSYRGDAQLGTWIDRITTRVAWRHLEGRGARTVRLELVREQESSPDTSPERRVMAREAARRLYAILDRIEPDHRVAYTLHMIDGRPLKDVASAMGASLVATKVRVFRARRMVEKRARLDPLLSDLVSVSDDEDPSGGSP